MTDLGLTIPCKIDDKPLGLQPVYTVRAKDETGADRCCWKCPHCGWAFARRKPCAGHMGLISNIPPTCQVLRKQAEERRKGDNVVPFVDPLAVLQGME